MAQLILDNVVSALNAAGIPAKRGYPGHMLGDISGSVAAVNLKNGDMREKTVTVLVTVAAPVPAACEETALAAGACLNGLGGLCRVGEARFHQGAMLFLTEVTAQFADQVPRITINSQLLTHVTAFTSWRSLDETVTDWDTAPWQFRLEEYVPIDQEEEPEPVGEFTLMHICDNGSESFLQCSWTYQRRVWDASGVRQIRLGVALGKDTG